MYKKITCAFCFVISTFIIAVVVYLLLTEWHILSSRPPNIKVPELAIYLVNGTTGEERRLHKTPNSQYILNFHSLGLSEDVPLPQEQRNLLRIRCHSNYPVQLSYTGYGNLTDASNSNRRKIGDFTDRATYNFSTELELRIVNEGVTGKYECQVRDELYGITKASTFIYIYAAGLLSFVPHSTRELIVEPNSPIEIPCPVSHPNKHVSLFMVKPLMEGSEAVKEVVGEEESEIIQRYDPRRGFILHANHYGLYFCKDRETEQLSGRVSVLQPLKYVVKGKPYRVYSQNVEESDKSLKLECRAKEPVELKFINFIKFPKEPRLPKNQSLDYPYGVMIRIQRDWFRGDLSIVECVTTRGRRVIKTWKFVKEDLPEKPDPDLFTAKVRLERLKNNEGYQCCAFRLNNLRPTLRAYFCLTPTECELRLSCLDIDSLRRTAQDPSCPLLEQANEDIYQGEEGCTVLKVGSNSSGLIRCSLDADVRDYTYFHASGLEGSYSSIMNSSKKKLEPGAVLKVVEKGARSQGAPIRFECFGSKLHFASGFQWAVERANEPLKYLANWEGYSFRSGSLTDVTSTVHQEWIDVPVTDYGNRKIYCIAPLINPPLYGDQWWMNVSTAFRYDMFW